MLCTINYEFECLKNLAVSTMRETSKGGNLPKWRTFAPLKTFQSLMDYEP